MRVIYTSGLLAALISVIGCPANDLNERLEKLEAKVLQLESRPTAHAPTQPAEQKVAYNLTVGTSQVKGNKDAPIAITVFSDYQCPFCSRVEPLLNEALNDPEIKDRVKIVFKNFPLSFHQEAKPAAKAAMAAGEQGRDMFWAMSDKLFAHQRELSADNYKKWAGEIKGLNLADWEKALKDNQAKYDQWIKEDIALGVSAKVRGTPSIFVGGWELRERSIAGIRELVKKSN